MEPDQHNQQTVLENYMFDIYEDWVIRGSSNGYIDFIDRVNNKDLIGKIARELLDGVSGLQYKIFCLELITLNFGHINNGTLQVKITKNLE